MTPIIDVKSILKYIFVSINKEISIYSYENLNKINIILSFPFLNEVNLKNEIWTSGKENLNEKIYIGIIEKNEKDISITSFFSKNFYKEQTITIKSNFYKIQNIFYIKELNQIFIVDEMGCYISSYDIETNKNVYTLYRGQKSGEIISICKVSNNHLAVVNKNKTIHIFDLKDSAGYNITNILYKIVSSTIYSYMKIRLKNVFKGFEDSFFTLYYNKYGCLVFNLEDNNEVYVIGYNGVGLIIKINFLKNDYIICNATKFLDKNTSMCKSIDINENEVLISSIYENKDLKPEKWDII